jgi:hypothetical protein
VVRRGEPTRDAPFQLTPLLLTSLIAAILCSVCLAVMWYVDANLGQPPPQPGQRPPPPPASHATLIVAASNFVIAWVAVIVAAVRDQIMRRIDHIADRVTAAAMDFAEQREEDGVFRGMKIASAEDDGPDPEAGPGGHVLPFQR